MVISSRFSYCGLIASNEDGGDDCQTLLIGVDDCNHVVSNDS